MASGMAVTQVAAVGTAPTPAGGTIADGTYVYTRSDVYAPASLNSVISRATLRTSGNRLEMVVVESGTAVSNATYMTSTAGTTWTWTGTCPVRAAYPQPYTATASTLVLFTGGTVVDTFTKQ
jgi:hypothetical protein